MRRKILGVVATATVVATLAFAAPASAAIVVKQTLGRNVVVYTSYPNDPTPTSKWTASAQGESVDTNDNGIADSLRGRAAVLESHGIIRVRIHRVVKQAIIGGVWTTVQANEADVVSEANPAYAVSYTTPNRYCATDPSLTRTYRDINPHAVRRVDGIVAERTTYSHNYVARALATDPACPETPPPPPPPTPDPANLEVAISDNPATVLNGQTTVLTVNASNVGDLDAAGGRLVIDYDDRFTLVAGSIVAPTGVTCAFADIDPTTGVDEAVVCDLGTLSGSEVDQIQLTLRADATGTLETVAVLSSTSTGVVDADDVETTVVVAAADLSIIKEAAAITATPSTTDYAFTFTVDNAGPNTATNVVVEDAWPSHLSDPVFLSSGCSFNNDTDTLRCTDSSVAEADTPVVFTVVANVLADGTNTATVDAVEADPTSANNSDSATVNL